MKNFKEFNKLVFDFNDDINYFADEYADSDPETIRTGLYDMMYSKFCKEIEDMEAAEEVKIKYKKKFYAKLFKIKSRLIAKDKTDTWLDRIFQRYFNFGLLEHLIVHAIKFLQKQDLFVPKRLFKQVDDMALLAQFTADAAEYLDFQLIDKHELDENEAVDEPITDETEETAEQPEEEQTPSEGEETAQEIPAETNAEDKQDESETEEIEEATQDAEIQQDESQEDEGIDTDAETGEQQEVSVEGETPVTSEKKKLPPFFTPGGKPSKKS